MPTVTLRFYLFRRIYEVVNLFMPASVVTFEIIVGRKEAICIDNASIITCEELVIKRSRHLFIIRLVFLHIRVAVASTIDCKPVDKVVIPHRGTLMVLLTAIRIQGKRVILWAISHQETISKRTLAFFRCRTSR